MGRIYCLIGKSSSGKDTIYKSLLNNDLDLNAIIPYTTRPIRNNEKEGVEYHFVDNSKLEELKALNKVIKCRSYETVHGVWSYFTVDDGSIQNDKDYLIIGTLETFVALKQYYGNVVPLYIEVDDGERLSRAMRREVEQPKPQYEEMCRRFLADNKDFSDERLSECGITKRFENINLKRCLDEIVAYIESKTQI